MISIKISQQLKNNKTEKLIKISLFTRHKTLISGPLFSVRNWGIAVLIGYFETISSASRRSQNTQ